MDATHSGPHWVPSQLQIEITSTLCENEIQILVDREDLQGLERTAKLTVR